MNEEIRWWLGLLLAALLAALGLLHVYWAAGGRWGKRGGIPTVDGQAVFNPSRGATLAVAGGLFAAMLLVLGRLGGVQPAGLFRWGVWGIAVVFGARAIGEFRLVGFFKRVRDTPFARWDTWLFSPLCVLLALLAWLLT